MADRPPPCPRCGTSINVRRGLPWLQPESWSCRYCLFEVWKADVLEQTRRLEAELGRILRDAA
jgi:hypothetical protein